MKKFPSSQRGFALVIALSLMAFVLLLILSISTLVQVESQSAASGMQQMRARLNAQLGAMIALGDLQRYTGPDQRVTARADILFAPGTDDVSGQSRWTGVWSSSDITNTSNISSPAQGLAYGLDLADGLHNRQARWLVSGNETNGLTIEPETLLSDDITTNLASLGGSVINKSGIKKDDTVKAPKVEILGNSNVAEGHYAFWVSDDGVKARVNMADPFLDSIDPEEEYYRTAMGQVADPTSVSNMDGVQLLSNTSSRWKDTSQDPSKISSLKNIPMFLEDDLPSGANLDGVSREFFHDFTVHSSGVLANTKDGGLKRDLSTALLNLPGDMRGPMFDPASGPVTLGDPGGPKWEQLADYFSLARSGSGDEVNFRMPTPDETGITPVVTRFNYVVQVFAERLPNINVHNQNGYIDKVTDYEYYVGIFPLITLWNPYNVDLKIPNLGLEFDMRGFVLRDGPIAGDLVAMLMSRNQVNYPQDQARRMIGMTINGGTIPAGRAVNYTPPINSKIVLGNASQNVLKQGATDSMIRGFFYGPINIENSSIYPKATGKDFFVSYGSQGMRPIPFGSTRDVGNGTEEITNQTTSSTNWNSGGQWSTVINLYSDTSLDKEKRFFAHSTNGIGKIYLYLTKHLSRPATPHNYTPRVISLNDLGVSSSAIKGVGESVDSAPSNNSDFDLKEMYNYSRGLPGLFVTLNLANNNRSQIDKPINLLTQFNPRAPKSFEQIHMKQAKRSAQRAGDSLNHMMGLRQYAKGAVEHWVPNQYRNWIDGTDDVYSAIGLSNLRTAGNYGSTKMVLFEAPNKTPISIGQLMHANLMNTSEISYRFDGISGWGTNHQQVHTTPAFAVGNSIANVHIPLTETKVYVNRNSVMFDEPIKTQPSGGWPSGNGGNNLKGSVYDYSYELNKVLWDEYFFSGLDPSAVEFPLPNSQIKRRPIIEGSSASSQEADLKDERLAAAHLMLNGAFNINSTSVAAWESILGAMRDIYTLGSSEVSDSEQLHNYSRFVSPIMNSVTSPFSDPEIGSSAVSYMNDHEAITAGYRSLTDKEIANLAEKLVDEIRRRSSVKEHPFLSLSSFINRSISQEDFDGSVARKRFMYTGAMQAAIDQSGLNGRTPFDALGVARTDNDGLWEDGYIYEPHKGASSGGSSQYSPYLEDSVAAIEGRPLLEGAPGFLMQADVLSKIGGKLNARSDTFTIRSYGNSTSPFTGSSEAVSYFELVVQRTPEYVDSLNNSPDVTPGNLNNLNRKFGRSYEIVSQRWINQDDI